MSKITWAPEAEIKVTGLEIEALVQLTELYDVALNSLSVATQNHYFSRARQAAADILKRMQEENISTTVEEEPNV